MYQALFPGGGAWGRGYSYTIDWENFIIGIFSQIEHDEDFVKINAWGSHESILTQMKILQFIVCIYGFEYCHSVN